MSNIFHPEKINLLGNPQITEAMIEQEIANNPSIIGLGDLILKDKQRIQPRSGRLDLLLQDPESQRRYEVEIQLGKSDESHIIRTIEYWDTERKRYPQYEHCAVIIAEDITSRFLNVISLFNGNIPIIAIQMNAYKFGEDTGLIFTKVLGETTFGLVDEDEEVREVTDRNYWLNRRTEKTVKIADNLLDTINSFSGGYKLNYTKFYIGLIKDGRPNNFVIFKPQQNRLVLEVRLPVDDEIQNKINKNELDDMGYSYGFYRLRLASDDLENKKEFLQDLLHKAYDNSQ